MGQSGPNIWSLLGWLTLALSLKGCEELQKQGMLGTAQVRVLGD